MSPLSRFRSRSLAVRTKPCVVYSMSSCPQCKKVKDVLTNLGAVHSEIELDEWEDGMAMKAELIGMGYSAIPATFVGGEYIGDADAVMKLNDQGALAEKLIAAGALSKVQRI
jgi:glutaredoxin 3